MLSVTLLRRSVHCKPPKPSNQLISWLLPSNPTSHHFNSTTSAHNTPQTTGRQSSDLFVDYNIHLAQGISADQFWISLRSTFIIFPYVEEMSGAKVTPLPEEEQDYLRSKFLGLRQGLVAVGPSRCLLPPHCVAFTKKYREFRFCKSDVVVTTFPRSGTTWTQEIIWTMRNGLNFQVASNVPLKIRSPFLEFDSLHPLHDDLREDLVASFLSRHPSEDPRFGGVFLQLSELAPTPRTIKTHLPFSLLPPDLLETCKVVYVARNPRDVCVSFYHQQSALRVAEFIGDFSDFVDFWCRDLYLMAPFWGHLKEGWARRQHRNLLFLFYEDMKENLMRELKRLDAFLGTGLTEEQLRQVAEFTSVSQMKKRLSANSALSSLTARAQKEETSNFIRQGVTGDWVNYFTPELEAKFQAWVKKGGKVATDIPFKY